MKKNILFKFLVLPLLALVWSASALAATTYTFDSGHTNVTWTVDHFGFSMITGKFMATGTFMWDEKNPAKSSVKVDVATNTLATAIPGLDGALKSSNFFNIEKYPSASFVSNKVKMMGKHAAKVYGTVTIMGISKPLVLDVKLTKHAENAYYKKDDFGFSATGKLKRSDFGLAYLVPNVGDEVSLSIQAEALLGTDDVSVQKK